MEKSKTLTVGMMVRGNDTKKRLGEQPRFLVIMKSQDKKTTLKLELPDLGRQIFQLYPMGEVVEIVLKQPSQITLDKFKEKEEEEE